MDPNTELYNAILKGDRNTVRALVRQAVGRNVDPVGLLNTSMIPPLHELGHLFESKQVLLPDLLVGARAMQAGLDILGPILAKKGHGNRARICIGTVQGDNHDIGKNIVAMFARAAGYQVNDLGKSCSLDQFAAAVDSGARAVLCSLMITTGIANLKTILKSFAGRPDVRTIIGGGVVTKELAAELGANAYGTDAAETVQLLDSFFR